MRIRAVGIGKIQCALVIVKLSVFMVQEGQKQPIGRPFELIIIRAESLFALSISANNEGTGWSIERREKQQMLVIRCPHEGTSATKHTDFVMVLHTKKLLNI